MKLTTFLFFLAITQIVASEAYSQTTKMTLQLSDASVKEVLNRIEEKSEFFFLYNSKLVDVNRKVSVNAKDERVDKILNNLFSETDVVYTVVDRQIVLTNKADQAGFMTQSGQQQGKKVTGKVTDSTGGSLPGVSVVVKGTTTGVVTDNNGTYSLANIPENATLQFSFIGMKTQEVLVGGKTTINTTLTEAVIGLEEVVAIGYGTTKKSDVTGSMVSLTSEKFNAGLSLAPEQMMQGKVAGVNITMNSGEPGANSKVRIRGGTSINASNDPLYVIDGVPVSFSNDGYSNAGNDRMTTAPNNPLNMLNPNDVEAISVLKDASATAIYGSRGANGVIIITTKKGKSGKSTIDYDGFVSVSSLRSKLDMLSSDEFRTYMKDPKTNVTGWKDGGASTDWQDEIFRTAIANSHNLAFTGGNDKTNYRASINYTKQEGIIIASDLEKITGRININHKAFDDKLTVNLYLTNSMLKNHSAPNPEGAGGEGSGGTIRDALRNDPTYPVKNANGAYIWHGVNNQNPIEETLVRSDLNESFRYLGNIMLDYKLTDFLSFNTNIGYTKENIDRMTYEPNSGRIGAQLHGSASHQFRNNNTGLVETNLVFNKKFNKHNINALAGYSYQQFVNTGAFISATNFITDATSYNAIGNGDKESYNLNTYKNSHTLISFYGRATYDYDGKYLLTGTVRRDGSTRFGENKRWGIFPSGALGWRVSEEEFLKNSDFISNLKLRVGYGITGNQEIGDYAALPILNAGGNKYIIGGKTISAVSPYQYPNPDLQWESTAQTNIGADFGFWKNRISGSLDLYKKKTSNLLLSFGVPSPAEITWTTANVGAVENKGIELELNGVILEKGPVHLEVFGNISHNINKVVSLSNDTWELKEMYTDGTNCPGFSGVTTRIIKPGYPLGTFWGPKYTGVDANGIQQFEDINKDGKFSFGEDRTVIGSSQPKFTYGFGSKIAYKRLSFDFFFRGIQGVDVLNSIMLDMADKTKVYNALADDARVNIARPAITDGLANNEKSIYSSKWIQDASFLRCENVTLNYNLNVSKLKFISTLNVYATGQNLFVISKYSGFDPEVASGIDAMVYPRPTTVMFGVKVQF